MVEVGCVEVSLVDMRWIEVSLVEKFDTVKLMIGKRKEFGADRFGGGKLDADKCDRDRLGREVW